MLLAETIFEFVKEHAKPHHMVEFQPPSSTVKDPFGVDQGCVVIFHGDTLRCRLWLGARIQIEHFNLAHDGGYYASSIKHIDMSHPHSLDSLLSELEDIA